MSASLKFLLFFVETFEKIREIFTACTHKNTVSTTTSEVKPPTLIISKSTDEIETKKVTSVSVSKVNTITKKQRAK